MRILLVPQRLASGKCSKRAPTKNILVCFEDAAAAVVEGKKAESSDGKGSKGKKKVQVDIVNLL